MVHLVESRIPQVSDTLDHVDGHDVSGDLVNLSLLHVLDRRMGRWERPRPSSRAISGRSVIK